MVWGLPLAHLTKMELFLFVPTVIETIFRNCNNELLMQEGSYSFLIRSRGLCVLKLSLRKEAVIGTIYSRVNKFTSVERAIKTNCQPLLRSTVGCVADAPFCQPLLRSTVGCVADAPFTKKNRRPLMKLAAKCRSGLRSVL
jgi:hypothetical protein